MHAESIIIILTLGLFLLSSLHSVISFFLPEKPRNRLGLVLVGLAAAGLVAVLVLKGIHSGRCPIVGPFGAPGFYALTLTAIYLCVAIRYDARSMSVVILPFVTLLLALGTLRTWNHATVNSGVRSVWLNGHVVTALAGYALFTWACILAVFYLIQDRNLKRKHFGRIFRALPALEILDRLMYRQILFAFGVFSLSIVLGIVLTHLNHWRAAWPRDPKIIATALTWVVYAVLLHLRMKSGEHGKTMAAITILGFVCVAITFFGINLFVPSMHKFNFSETLGG